MPSSLSASGRALLVVVLICLMTSIPTLSGNADPGSPAARWERKHERLAPQSRGRASMAYDEARETLVLFGGLSTTGQLRDTWLYDGTWKRVEPDISPSVRLGTAMAYDAARGEIVMFGGHSGSQRLNETWVWDGSTWTQRAPAMSPPARSFGAMAYDAARGEIVLFGGMKSGGGSLGDTWTWDGATWTQRPPAPSPPSRDSASMAYDPAREEVVMFGGYGSGGPLADTWTWNGSTWTQETPATSPPKRNSAGVASDPSNGTVVLFGGIDNSGHRNDTWTWNGSTWAEASPATSPPPRSSMAMGWHEAEGEVVMFGGSSANLDRDDTWTWDGTRWLSRDELAPDALHSATASTGPDGGIVLFGGMTDSGMSDDTWTWDGGWELAATSGPPARTNAAMVYDSISEVVIMFGGMGFGGTELADMWIWDGRAWTERESTVAPPPRHNHVMAYNSYHRQVVLFGGSNADLDIVFSDTWTWNGIEWTLRTPGTSPPPLSAAAMTYDLGKQNTVMFGGYDQNVQRTNETWIWNGFNWSEAQPSTSPVPRAAGHLSYEPSLGVPVLFGGNAGLGEHLADAWAWDGAAWVELQVPGPPDRFGAAFAYSPAAGGALLFGGNRNRYLGDTWILRPLRRIGSDPLLILNRERIEGPFWHVYAVSVAQDGAGAAFELEPSFEDARGIGYGLYAVRAGTLESESFFIGTGHGTVTEVLVDEDSQAIHEEFEHPGGISGRTSGFTTTFDDLERGEYYFVIVNTSPGADLGTVRLYGDSRITLAATSRGTSGGLAREIDFEGPRNVQVRTGTGPLNVHAGVIEDGTYGVRVAHRLFGIFQSSASGPSSPNDISYVRPDGSEATGGTTYVLSARAPGDYMFKVNDWRSVHAGFGSSGNIALLTADVAFPPFS